MKMAFVMQCYCKLDGRKSLIVFCGSSQGAKRFYDYMFLGP